MGRFIQNGTGVIVSVADHKDDRFGAGWTREGEQAKSKFETPDKSWKVDELKQFATDNAIDLGEATKKDDILAALTAAADQS